MSASSTFLSSLIAGAPDRTPKPTADGLMFAYVGPADKVEVQVMEDRFPRIGAMQKVNGSDVWYVEAELESDGSLEYKLAITRKGSRRLVLDPRNADRTVAPFGSNSVATGPAYAPPRWLNADAESGSIQAFPVVSEVWTRTKRHEVYLPPGFSSDEAYPLLVMHDGPEYVRYSGLARCLDWLISSRLIPPLLVLLHRPHQRNVEYVDNDHHSSHLFDEVIPLIRERVDIGAVYGGGASLGAVAALFAGFREPGSFDGVLLQSGSFVWELGGPFKRGPVLAPVTIGLPEILRQPDHLPERIVMSCGTYDGLVEDHRTLVPLLSERHPDVSYSEINAGHHWRCWRDRLEADLLRLFENA